MSFPCTACGACCRRVGAVLGAEHPPDSLLGEAVASFPYPARADGSCEQLTDDGKCAVYETRPLLCRVEEMREQAGIPRGAYYLLAALACNTMQVEDGVPVSFRVPLPTLPSDDV